MHALLLAPFSPQSETYNLPLAIAIPSNAPAPNLEAVHLVKPVPSVFKV